MVLKASMRALVMRCRQEDVGPGVQVGDELSCVCKGCVLRECTLNGCTVQRRYGFGDTAACIWRALEMDAFGLERTFQRLGNVTIIPADDVSELRECLLRRLGQIVCEPLVAG